MRSYNRTDTFYLASSYRTASRVCLGFSGPQVENVMHTRLVRILFMRLHNVWHTCFWSLLLFRGLVFGLMYDFFFKSRLHTKIKLFIFSYMFHHMYILCVNGHAASTRPIQHNSCARCNVLQCDKFTIFLSVFVRPILMANKRAAHF